LLAIGGINIAIPELLVQSEAPGERKDEISVGSRLALRRDDRRSQLDERLRVGSDLREGTPELRGLDECTGKLGKVKRD